MNSHRLFNLFVAIALVVVTALTVREAAATTVVVSQTASAGPSVSECASLPSRYSIRSENVKETGLWVTYTEDGPTGVDGGLIDLLSNSRACSTK